MHRVAVAVIPAGFPGVPVAAKKIPVERRPQGCLDPRRNAALEIYIAAGKILRRNVLFCAAIQKDNAAETFPMRQGILQRREEKIFAARR